jgi:hypothetical protein
LAEALNRANGPNYFKLWTDGSMKNLKVSGNVFKQEERVAELCN